MNDRIKGIWDKIVAGANVAGAFASKTAETAGKKATDVFNTSKLSLKVFDLKTDIDVLYKEVGRMIYAAHTNEEASTEELDAKLLEIDKKLSEIEEIKVVIENSRTTKKCPECERENPRDSAFCAGCGTRLDI
ncbi:MAG: zinc ribbon domain-containing protein [Oscillospiraceae bacterium]|nr:zinc ribbon domain-containing protein [Oscillospiraceae bacterium]